MCYHGPWHSLFSRKDHDATLRAHIEDRGRGEATPAPRRDAQGDHGEPTHRDHPPLRAPELPPAQGPLLPSHPRAGGPDQAVPRGRRDDGQTPGVPRLPQGRSRLHVDDRRRAEEEPRVTEDALRDRNYLRGPPVSSRGPSSLSLVEPLTVNQVVSGSNPDDGAPPRDWSPLRLLSSSTEVPVRSLDHQSDDDQAEREGEDLPEVEPFLEDPHLGPVLAGGLVEVG